MPSARTPAIGDLVFVPCSSLPQKRGARVSLGGGAEGAAAAAAEGSAAYADVAFLEGRVVALEGDDGDRAVVEVLPLDAAQGQTEQHSIPLRELRSRFPREDGKTCADNTALVHMNDATILENLRCRHAANEIYTYTASVLLAVNPYKDIPGLYGEEQCAAYRGKHIGACPPHPYAIADAAYRALTREDRNQGLLISGESGAGKTETAKIVMQYLAFASNSSSKHADQIQARVLRAQPILESFGNAVTMRNNNSSRFGKYNRVFFTASGSLVDAGITTYLLESSRVVVHAEGERTYHCFYEMLAGLDSETLKTLNLSRTGSYRLLCPDGVEKPLQGFESRDATNFKRLEDALHTLGLDPETIGSIWRTLAGLIHLGDLDEDFGPSSDSDDSSGLELNRVSLHKAAGLLGMDPDVVKSTLTMKKVKVPGRTSFHEVPRSVSQFRHALLSFIKALYKRLFERVVAKLNEAFRQMRPEKPLGDEETWKHIGILDIYGFENLERNSFEQLCINLANERLQQYFVENALRAEQDLYNREGLPWMDLPLPDGRPVFNAISQAFRILDEYSQNLTKGVGNATDKGFCQKVLEDAQKDAERNRVLKPIKIATGGRKSIVGGLGVNDAFTIKHYAGQVQYNTAGWLDKNNDRLLTECECLICDSTDHLVRSLGEEEETTAKPVFRSISKKYQKDLEMLLETLSTCNLHYIRCFKPNGEQRPDVFQNGLVLDQVVQCGTIELVKIMHDGFPNRCSFQEITNRFRDLLPESFQRYGMRTFIEALMLAYDVPQSDWALGMSKLFLKAGQLSTLEGLRNSGASVDPARLAEIVRSIVRKRWRRGVHAILLCNYIPKLMQRIRIEKARKKLQVAVLLASRLSTSLAAARARIQQRRLASRRRLAGLFHSIHLVQGQWMRVQKQRKEQLLVRVQHAFRLHFFIHRSAGAALGRARRTLEAAREQRRLEAEEAERSRLEAERLEQERLEQERLEQERLEQERLEQERLEQERLEQQRLEQERAEKERLEQLEQERIKEELAREEQQEAERLEQERQERERLEQEKLRLEEEKNQAQLAAKQREEELEKQRKELQKRALENQKVFEEERKRLAEERAAFEEAHSADGGGALASTATSGVAAVDAAAAGSSASDGGPAKPVEVKVLIEKFAHDAKAAMEESDDASQDLVNDFVHRLQAEFEKMRNECKLHTQQLEEKRQSMEETIAQEQRKHKEFALASRRLSSSACAPLREDPEGEAMAAAGSEASASASSAAVPSAVAPDPTEEPAQPSTAEAAESAEAPAHSSDTSGISGNDDSRRPASQAQDAPHTGERTSRPSLLPLDGEEEDEVRACSPLSSKAPSLLLTSPLPQEASPPQTTLSQSQRRTQECSPLSIEASASSKRSAKHRAAFAGLVEQDGSACSGRRDSVGGASSSGSARKKKWYAEQRLTLLQDLYPDSPGLAEAGEALQHRLNGSAGRNLDSMFERASDDSRRQKQPPPLPDLPFQDPASTAKFVQKIAASNDAPSSKIRPPTKFNWRSRKSAVAASQQDSC